MTKKQIEKDKLKSRVYATYKSMLSNKTPMNAIKDTSSLHGICISTIRNYVREVEANKDYFDKLEK